MGIASLSAALSGLRISQQQINLISTNIANAGTPGYTRKILPQSSQSVQGVTVGVTGQTILRKVDTTLERDLWTQVSSAGALEVKKTYLNRVQQFHGAPEKEVSIAARLAKLKNSFETLSDNPQDIFAQSTVVAGAQDVARKLNDFSSLLTVSRNDAQNEIISAVGQINNLLEQIASLNDQVRNAALTGRSTAAFEDLRGEAIKALSGFMDISSFARGDGVVVVQTTRGIELASDKKNHLAFSPTPLSAQSYYPASAAAVYVNGPDENRVADITAIPIGGRLGGLLELRDSILPKQLAQVDEVAHKLALRLDKQGLRLFTDASGNIPSDAAPDPTANPPVPVAYVGFAAKIQVNPAILSDPDLLQAGTYGANLPAGSNEVIRRVTQFGFGDTEYQRAIGTLDLRVSLQSAPNNTLQKFLGVQSTNTITGVRNLGSFTSPASFIAASNGAFPSSADTFRLTFQDADRSLGPVNIDIDLSAIPDGSGNFVQDLIAHVTGTVIPGLSAGQQTALSSMGVVLSESASGQLVINSNADITIDGTGVANGMGAQGLALLGLAEQTRQATDPYFEVQVGENDPVRITIGPADDETDLYNKLAAVPGLGVKSFSTSTGGVLRLRSGGDYDSPAFGGDLKITSGPFKASGAGANTVIGAGTVPNGVNLVTALFGSFTASPLVENSPVASIAYASASDSGVSASQVAFRTQYLGPGVDISTSLPGARTIVDYAQKMVNEQTQDYAAASSKLDDETVLRDALQKQLADDSGVNVDEELGQLVVMQTAYSAAARIINAVNELFQDLLNAVA